MTVAIVAAGQFPRSEYPKYLLNNADAVICCDGALSTLEKHSIVPDVVIGDLDSVCARTLGRFKGRKIHDCDQQTNDLTKAFRLAMKEYPQADTIHIIGGTGRSEAHTLGNLSLLMQYEKEFDLNARGISVDMVSDWSTSFAVSDSCELHLGQGRRISLFSCDTSLRIRSRGLVWPLDEVVFDNWWKATLNIASEDVVSLTLSHRAPVLVVLD